MEEDQTKMVLPCQCPNCGQDIVVTINQPHPTIDVMAPDEVSEEIKNAINDKNEDDYTQEPEAA